MSYNSKDKNGTKPTKKKVERTFEKSDELQKLAERVIKEQNLDVSKAKIEYLLVYPNVSKTVAGRCIRTGRELKFYSDKDYLIEMSGELWDNLEESVRYVLMQHEIMHVLPVENEKTGDMQYKIRAHDVEDFSKIIKTHGHDWISKVKLTISSIYDLTPSEEDSITI
jgi:predicted metallopeptidase